MVIHGWQQNEKTPNNKELHIQSQVPRPAQTHFRSGIQIVDVQNIPPPVSIAVDVRPFTEVQWGVLVVVGVNQIAEQQNYDVGRSQPGLDLLFNTNQVCWFSYLKNRFSSK